MTFWFQVQSQIPISGFHWVSFVLETICHTLKIFITLIYPMIGAIPEPKLSLPSEPIDELSSFLPSASPRDAVTIDPEEWDVRDAGPPLEYFQKMKHFFRIAKKVFNLQTLTSVPWFIWSEHQVWTCFLDVLTDLATKPHPSIPEIHLSKTEHGLYDQEKLFLTFWASDFPFFCTAQRFFLLAFPFACSNCSPGKKQKKTKII